MLKHQIFNNKKIGFATYNHKPYSYTNIYHPTKSARDS